MNVQLLTSLAFIFNPADPSWQFWLGAISLAATLVGIPTIASIIRSARNRPGKRLSYQIVSDVGLVNQEKDSDPGITVMLKGGVIGTTPVVVNKARVIMLKLINTGSEAIESSDFRYDNKEKLHFKFADKNLIYCAVHDTEPEDLIPLASRKGVIHLDALKPYNTTRNLNSPSQSSDQVQVNTPAQTKTPRLHQFVDLDGRFLNPGNAITLKFVTLDQANVEIEGQLKNGEAIKLYTPPAPVFTARRAIAGLAVAFLIGLLLSRGIGLIGAFWQGNCAFSLSPAAISGSTAFYDTAQMEASAYREICPIAALNVGSSDSAAGLTQLENKNLDIADSELSLKDAGYTYSDLSEHQVAVIVFTMIVNKDVGITSLSRAQITKIYNGQITNWRQVKGPDLPIVLFGRPSGSGTQAAFTRYVLSQPESSIKNPVSSTQEVINGVGGTSGAIGYTDLGSADRAAEMVTALDIDGKAASTGLVENNQYQFWAIERMYTRDAPGALSLSFVNYVINNIRTGDTFIRIADMSPVIRSTHE